MTRSSLAAEVGPQTGDEGRCERVGAFTTQLVSGDVAVVYHPLPARGPAPVIAFLQGCRADVKAGVQGPRWGRCAGSAAYILNFT